MVNQIKSFLRENLILSPNNLFEVCVCLCDKQGSVATVASSFLVRPQAPQASSPLIKGIKRDQPLEKGRVDLADPAFYFVASVAVEFTIHIH